MRNYADFSLKNTIHECNRHVEKIRKARDYLSFKLSLTIEAYKQLNDVDESFIDQLIVMVIMLRLLPGFSLGLVTK